MFSHVTIVTNNSAGIPLCGTKNVERFQYRGRQNLALGAFVLLAFALLIALGFEFVDGFHDIGRRFWRRCRWR